ncbi:MAG: TRAP transporter substrate-binding protein [Hoeflea sp.]|uniref:TRAP transporter substrate-binding protein n=1 Tax=Hoeflea sp. TaxID=1940281 RepID=UPI001D61FC51|nr:TRAP transporter substrate-binding protein [Hoeflea sp.]MBU4531170.1 TRAP transporter substrate-binding protein [Alphaproteobacteria bacterium]MBU4545768.1 TRAP transporter substrate-binding protein [Alphaproteobacteria bacterium]MBU4550737.1 TRAP transporter substrate-binding protein [Alphaproteobacteria bacterium]MBV1724447.1 TRAP transporter substrate-binding protein [Hoeflea sp.]MBV1760467.1 TRAP transporter substrate-binding protein [Hoeflea sp.]
MKKLLAALAMTTLLAAASAVSAQEARLGYVPIPDHPVGKGSIRFAELVSEKTDGRITIETFGNGVLGNEPQMQSSLQGGFLDVMVGPTSNLVGTIPEFLIFDLPFFYADFDAVDAVTDGRVGDTLFAKLEEMGLVGLAYWDNGFRHMTNAIRPINTVEDMAGLKIRVIPNPLFISTFEALGTNPIPLPYPELYNALESNTVDAQETPVGLIYSSKFYEVQDHLALTGHVYTPYVLLASKKWFDGLAEEDQKRVMEAAQESAEYQRSLSRDDADRLTGLLEEEGMKVTRLSEEEMTKLRDAVAPVVAEFSETIGTELVEQAREDMANDAN